MSSSPRSWQYLAGNERNDLLSLALSSKGGEGNRVADCEHRDPCQVQSGGASLAVVGSLHPRPRSMGQLDLEKAVRPRQTRETTLMEPSLMMIPASPGEGPFWCHPVTHQPPQPPKSRGNSDGRIRELLVLGRSAGLLAGLPRPVYRSGRSGLRSSVIADLSRLLALFVRCKPAICRRSAKDSRMRPVETIQERHACLCFQVCGN